MGPALVGANKLAYLFDKMNAKIKHLLICKKNDIEHRMVQIVYVLFK